MKSLLPIASLLLISACTWVKLSPEGENISVLTEQEFTSQADRCSKIGTTSVTVLDKVVLRRSPKKVARELETLARNKAAARGNVLVPTSPAEGGEQDFDIYQCE